MRVEADSFKYWITFLRSQLFPVEAGGFGKLLFSKLEEAKNSKMFSKHRTLSSDLPETMALIVSVHPYGAPKFTCQVMHRCAR